MTDRSNSRARPGSPVWGAALAAAAGCLALAACDAGDGASSSSTAAITTNLGGVHGYVAVRVPGQPATQRQPGLSAYLRNATTGVQVGPKVTSDVHGRYVLPPQPPAAYQLCVEGVGVVTNCAAITLTQETFNAPGERAMTTTGGVVWGSVLLADGKPCYHENAGMGAALTTTTVSLRDVIGRDVAHPVTANARGQFLLSGINGTGTFTLHASCAGSTVDHSVVFSGGASGPSALTFADHSPVAISIIGKLAGVPIRHAPAGALVDVTVSAFDADGDPLHYLWSDGTSGLTTVDAPTITWHLPSVDATATLFVEVSDGRGGVASARLTLSTTNANPLFSGVTLSDATGAPLAGAQISINGGPPVTSDAMGRFQLRVPEATRYTINATKAQFALASHVYHGPATGVELRLAPALRTVCNPKLSCTVSGLENSTFRLVLGANTLVNKLTGQPPAGSVNVDVANINLSRSNAMPGDFSGIDSGGRPVALVSAGAVNVDIDDDAGNKYTLAQGKTAQLSIPVDPTVLGRGAPAQIPLWEYEEATGLWRQKSSATFNPQTRTFDGAVPGFSTWNADTVFTNTACIRFTRDPARPPPFPFKLHVSIPSSAGTVNHNDFSITEEVNGLFRLPPNIPVTLEVHPASGPDAVLSSVVVNSGPSIDPATGGFPTFDFTDCHGFDPASTLPGQPVQLGLDIPNHTAPWLSPTLFSPFGVGDDAETRAYYNAIAGVTIDPLTNACTPPVSGPNRCDLAGFQTANGLATDYPVTGVLAPGEVVSYFYNAGDLGLGREMHCKKTGSNVACYVTNYGNPFPPAAEPVSAIANAIAHVAPIASVAMEYDASAPAFEGVRFYVYPAGGTLALKAELDSEGPKNVPQLCLACHGGVYDTTAHKVLGAAFREFDVYSYLYDTTTWTLSNQQQNFRKLNEMVFATSPNAPPLNSNDPIRGLISRMYDTCGGVSAPGCTADTTDLPAAWNGTSANQALYNTIVKPYCRACHNAQASFIDWTSPGSFTSAFVEAPVCLNHDMPHGEVPFRKFWLSTSPSAPVFLTGALGLLDCPR